MKRIIMIMLITGFTLLSLAATPSIAKTAYSDLAIEASVADKNKAVDINNAGVRHYRSRHYTEASSFFGDALAADPNLAEAHFNLGLIYHKKKKHEKAAHHFTKARQLAPNDMRILNSEIAKMHMDSNMMKEMTAEAAKGGGHKDSKAKEKEEEHKHMH